MQCDTEQTQESGPRSPRRRRARVHRPFARGSQHGTGRRADAKFRLADAQAVIARKCGFDSWPVLARHVQ
jgi:hypothetical protein